MKKLIVALCAALMAMSLAACGGSSSASSSASGSASSSTAEASSASATSASSPASASSGSPSAASADSVASALSAELEANEGKLTAADLANVDVTIEYGDYDGMQALAKDIQNSRADGTVVQIDGDVSHFAQGMSFNIVEHNADRSKQIGTTFVIQGAEESAYPADGTHIKLTGKVVAEGMTHHILTLPEFVEVIEG